MRVLVCGVGRPFRARAGVGRGDPGRCPGLPWYAPLGRGAGAGRFELDWVVATTATRLGDWRLETGNSRPGLASCIHIDGGLWKGFG